jgi:hypothetical protein
MANPNIVNMTSLHGETAATVATMSFVDLIENVASSNKVYKINSLSASNVSTIESVDVSVNLVRSSNSYAVVRNLSIPTTSSLIAISKDHSLYLQEGDKLQVKASGVDSIEIICSYEVIS